MKKLLATLVFLGLANFAAAFTPEEVVSLAQLRNSQLAIRKALVSLEVNIATKTDVDTRVALGAAEHALSESDEHEVNSTYLWFGAAAKRDDVQRDKMRGGPRSVFVAAALQELLQTDKELKEAVETVNAAGLLRTDDPDYQLQIQRTKFYLGIAIAKLALFDRTLTYEFPPLPVLQFDEGFEAFGQYGYDIVDLLIAAWNDGYLFPNYRAYAGVLSQFWFVQNSGIDIAFRSAGIISGTVDDSLESVLGGGTSSINQRLHNMLINLAALDGTREGRPVFNAAWLRIIGAKYSDLWRHADRMANATRDNVN